MQPDRKYIRKHVFKSRNKSEDYQKCRCRRKARKSVIRFRKSTWNPVFSIYLLKFQADTFDFPCSIPIPVLKLGNGNIPISRPNLLHYPPNPCLIFFLTKTNTWEHEHSLLRSSWAMPVALSPPLMSALISSVLCKISHLRQGQVA